MGDDFVSFIASRGSGNDAEDVATLTVESLGVKPGVNGSVMMTVTDGLGDDAMHTAKYDGAVRTMRALQETAKPMGLVATVEQRFMSFGDATMGPLGSFMVGLNTDYLNAENGAPISGDLNDDNGIMMNSTSSVTISGDFSFASMAWLDTAGTCDAVADPPDLLQRADEMVMDELMGCHLRLQQRSTSAFRCPRGMMRLRFLQRTLTS